MSTVNRAVANHATNTTDDLCGVKLTTDWRGVNRTWATRGRLAEGLAEPDGLSDGLTLMEIDEEADVLGERLGEVDTLGEADGEPDSLPLGLSDGDSLALTDPLGDTDGDSLAEGLPLALGD